MKEHRYYDLKPCPFCGGKAILERSHRAFIKAQTTRVAFVRCKECNARSGRFNLEDYGRTSRSQEAEQAAVNAWNKRTEDGGTWLPKFTLTEEGDIL